MVNLINVSSQSVGHSQQFQAFLDKWVPRWNELNAYGTPEGQANLTQAIKYVHNVSDQLDVLITNSATSALDLIFSHISPKEIAVYEPAYFAIHRQVRSRRLTINPKAATLYDGSQHSSHVACPNKLNHKNHPTVIFDYAYDLIEGSTNLSGLNLDQIGHQRFYIGSFTKVFGPGARLGYIIAHKNQIAHLRSISITRDLHANLLIQQFTLDALENDMLTYQQAFYLAIKAAITNKFPSIHCAGLCAHLPFENLGQRNEFLRENNLVIEPNKFAWFDQTERPYARINITKLPIENLLDLFTKYTSTHD